MNKRPFLYLSVSFLVFFGLIGLSFYPIPKEGGMAVAKKQIKGKVLDIALDNLDVKDKQVLDSLQKSIDQASTSGNKLEALKAASGLFYKKQLYVLAGYFAEEVAKLENKAEAWFIAGTSYLGPVGSNRADSDIELIRQKTLDCFDQAENMDKSNINVQIQKAITYTELPLKEEPMKGILALRELNSAHPENVEVLRQLVRLSIKTNQWDRAIKRLEEWKKLDPQNVQIECLMAEVYQQLGNGELAYKHQKLCR